MTGPANCTVALACSFTATAKDTSDTAITVYTGIVTFSSSDSLATLPADYTFVLLDGGSHLFPVTFGTGGGITQTVTISDTVIITALGSASVTVIP